MNPFSEIELDLITGFALVIAYGITIWGGVMCAVIVLRHALEWIDRRFPDPEPEPTPVTGTRRREAGTTTTTARVSLYIVPPAPHRPWVEEADYDLLEIVDPKREGLRCPQGLRVIHRGGAK